MRCLVTGGSGFAGANLVRRLLRDGHEVHLLLRPEFDPWRLSEVLSECRVHLCDLLDTQGLFATLELVRPEWVFHLAVAGAYPDQADSELIMRANVMGSTYLVEACLKTGVGSYINTGSSSEYGYKDDAPDETEALQPRTAYAVSKAAATQYCTMASLTRGLPGVTLRLYSVYGPWERPTRLIPSLLQHARAGRWPPLAAADSAHDFVFVDDVSDAFVRAAAGNPPPGAVYNIGSGVQTTLAELVRLTGTLLPVPEPPKWGSMPGRAWDTSVWVSNSQRAVAELGWLATTSLEAGLRITLERLP